MRLLPSFDQHRRWLALGVLVPFGMLIVSGLMLLDMRKDAWLKAEHTSRNLLQVMERDIARNVEIFDLSLRAVVENLRMPGVAELALELRQLVLFDRAASAKDIGVLLVIDEKGDVAIDAASVVPRKANYLDRDYFQAHKLRNDLGLYIGTPLVSRLTGARMIPLSRRISKPDGSFGGVVLGTMQLSYFSKILSQISLGQDDAINLYHRDGTRIMRHPFVESDIGANIAGASTFDRFAREGRGTFIDTSVRDGVERHYTFTQIGDFPLILNVALATKGIEATWLAKAAVIGTVVLMLCGINFGLSLMFVVELRRRTAVQAQLTWMSRTDFLTGLPNRRRFDEAFAQAWESARWKRTALSLLIIDADHFKRINDRYGHAIGDEVLQKFALRLAVSVHRPEDLVCRIGGEEFVVLLPETEQAGALRIAEKIHEEVSALAVAAAGIAPGTFTVSIGLATLEPERPDLGAPIDLYRLADAALYEAKAGGRNQTRCAEPYAEVVARKRTVLRVLHGTSASA